VGTSRGAKAIPIPVVQEEAAIPARGIFHPYRHVASSPRHHRLTNELQVV